jgi:hypothetical protein
LSSIHLAHPTLAHLHERRLVRTCAQSQGMVCELYPRFAHLSRFVPMRTVTPAHLCAGAHVFWLVRTPLCLICGQFRHVYQLRQSYGFLPCCTLFCAGLSFMTIRLATGVFYFPKSCGAAPAQGIAPQPPKIGQRCNWEIGRALSWANSPFDKFEF